MLTSFVRDEDCFLFLREKKGRTLGISQVATISMRDNPEDEVYVAGIK